MPAIREMRSDMAVCKEVLINRAYSSHRIFKVKKRDKVLDLGGNTGLASASSSYSLELLNDLRLVLLLSPPGETGHHLRACKELLRAAVLQHEEAAGRWGQPLRCPLLELFHGSQLGAVSC